MSIRCPKMDGFGSLLIEAYRQREEAMNRKRSLLELSYAADKIAQINAMISEHRNQCVVCRRLDTAYVSGPLSE